MKCIKCNSERVQKDGNSNGKQRYKCLDCKKSFLYGVYEGKIEYIEHFKTKIQKLDRNKLTRDNYCIPTNKISYVLRKSLENSMKNNNYKFPTECYKDEKTYTDEYVQKHYEDCMYNFDLNMKYFNSLDSKEFNRMLNEIIEKHDLKDVVDLKEYNKVRGLYILVLDEYKQVYVGVSDDIKHRIITHWSAKKEFDRMIFGRKENSILSIDSFGALDTTRIFVKTGLSEMKMYSSEAQIVSDVDGRYCLNRVAGGINFEKNEDYRNVMLVATQVRRDLENNE